MEVKLSRELDERHQCFSSDVSPISWCGRSIFWFATRHRLLFMLASSKLFPLFWLMKFV